MFNIKTKSFIASSSAILLSAVLMTACSSDDDDKAKVVKGTAATGAPIVGTVSLVDADGNPSAMVDIEADGSFRIKVGGMTPPFMLKAVRQSDGEDFYSLADGRGVANVTSITDLAIYLATDSDPAVLYSGWSGSNATMAFDTFDANIGDALLDIYGTLVDEMVEEGVDLRKFNPFEHSFDANGTGIDGVMDEVVVAFDAALGTVSLEDGEGNDITLLEDLDFDDVEALIAEAAGIDTETDTDTDTSGGSKSCDDSTADVCVDSGLGGEWSLVTTVNDYSYEYVNVPAPASVSEVEASFAEYNVSNDQGVTIELLDVSAVTDTASLKEYTLTYTVTTVVEVPGFDPEEVTVEYTVTYAYTKNS